MEAVITYFENPKLNEVGAGLIDLYKGSKEDIRKAQEHFNSAIIRRWKAGKMFSDNEEAILEECETQRTFAEKIGVTEATLSNDKRAYKALAAEGAETEEDVLELLENKKIRPVVSNWEKLPRLLNDPESPQDKDMRARDEKRLEDLHAEIEEIKVRNEGANPAVAERAEDTLSYLDAVEQHIGAQDVFRSSWRSREYLDFVKSIGFDLITGQQSEALDPHHTLPDGSARGPKGKVADVFTIPVTRLTHDKIETGLMSPSRHETSEALIRTMALFIITHMQGDNE